MLCTLKSRKGERRIKIGLTEVSVLLFGIHRGHMRVMTCYHHLLPKPPKSQVLDSADVDVKNETLVTRTGNYRPIGSGRNSEYSVENGSYRNCGRHSSAYYVTYADDTFVVEGKPFKRGGSSSYGSNEKQVWVLKSVQFWLIVLPVYVLRIWSMSTLKRTVDGKLELDILSR